jgi:hypothetical protein
LRTSAKQSRFYKWPKYKIAPSPRKGGTYRNDKKTTFYEAIKFHPLFKSYVLSAKCRSDESVAKGGVLLSKKEVPLIGGRESK